MDRAHEEMYLDDLLRRGGWAYDRLPRRIFLGRELDGLLQGMEHEANTDGVEREAGTLLGFSDPHQGLHGLEVRVRDGGAFDPRVFLPPNEHDFGRVALGFQYQGTVHTHPRRAEGDPLVSFSGIDVKTVVDRTYQEIVSIMVCGPLVHVLIWCVDPQPVTEQDYLTDLVVASLEEALADVEGEMELDEERIRELAQGTQTLGAVAAAARALHLGYYVGQLGGELLLMSR